MMKYLQAIWERFVDFLVQYDSRKLTEIFRALDWQEVLHNPIVWLVGLPLLAFLVWKRHFHTLLLLFSVMAFVALLLSVLPPAGQPIPLNKIIAFAGGSLALVAVNLYFFLVRG